jgi:hypothetical protein
MLKFEPITKYEKRCCFLSVVAELGRTLESRIGGKEKTIRKPKRQVKIGDCVPS